MEDELFIGVGCLEAQWLPFAVLRHSILRHASRPVRVEPLFGTGIGIPMPRDERNRPKTPFSFQRFLIPELRGYKGRAIYLDSDMLVFGDIAPLFELDFGDANVLAVPHETSVMVLDCSQLSWRITAIVNELDEGRLSYDALMTCRAVAKVRYSLPLTWNWLDNANRQPPADLKLLHYTVTSSQPWLTSGHLLGHLWIAELFAALDDGGIRHSEVHEAIRRGFVRPSLARQIEQRALSREQLPADALRADEPFASYCRSVHYAIVQGFEAAEATPGVKP